MKIAGRIQNHSIKSSKLIAAISSGSGHMILAETPVLADGSFEMVLPDIVLGYSFLFSPRISCKKIDINPESLKIAVIDAFWVFDSNEIVIGHVYQSVSKSSTAVSRGEKVVSRWYANQSGKIHGRASCGPHGIDVNFDLSLKKGWNEVVRYFGSDTKESIYSFERTGRTPWFMVMREPLNENRTKQIF